MEQREFTGASAHVTAASIEFWCAAAALAIALAAAGLLLLSDGSRLIRYYNIGSFAVSTLLGPLLAFVGAWVHLRRGEALGIIALGLAVLLTLNGAVTLMTSGVILGLPAVVLVTASFVAGVRRVSATREDEPS